MPAPSTPRGHFTSLTQQCRNAARYRDMKRLQAYLASPRFVAALAAQEGEMVRRIAIRVMTESLADCASKVPGRRRPRPRKRIRWDATTVARFRKALFRGGLQAGANAVGITYQAARMALYRVAPDYVLPATGYHRQAA